jgi:hypothetical protein
MVQSLVFEFMIGGFCGLISMKCQKAHRLSSWNICIMRLHLSLPSIDVPEIHVLSVCQISESSSIQISRFASLDLISSGVFALHQGPEREDDHDFKEVAGEKNQIAGH